MKHFLITFAALFIGASITGCGSNAVVESQNATNDQAAAQPQAQNLDCDKLMHDLAESCFNVTVFEEDGKTPLHMTDEAGNDLGEVDRQKAGAYCECYAQLAFQTFGCQEVAAHQTLEDNKYDELYSPIIESCAADFLDEEFVEDPNLPQEGIPEAAPAGTDAAPAGIDAP